MIIYCCAKFARHCKDNVDVGFVKYQDSDDSEETWGINGCCGGGCLVVSNMKFCPFCGTNLKELEEA